MGLDAVRQAIGNAKKIVVVGHVTPDADCLGAMLGMVSYVRSNGSQPVAIELPGGQVPGRLRFLLEDIPAEMADEGWRESCDTVVVVDTAKAARANADKQWDFLNSDRTVINVDHHAPNPGYGTVNWIEGNASSTCELIHRLHAATGRKMDPATASVLYAGIFTDTAGFSLPNTTAEALEAAASIVRAGADVATLGEKLERSQRKCDFDLLRIIYDRTELVDDGRIAYSSATYDEITGAGCIAVDIDDQVSVPRSLEGIYVGILFTEGVKGKIRLNFRGEQGVGVLELARGFGGGGHQAAAGAIIDGTIEAVVQQVLPATSAYLDRILAEK